jgi:hypothetical protein
MTSRKLALLHAILAGAQVVTGAAGLADLVGARSAQWAVLIVAALQVTVAAYADRITTTPADRIPGYIRRGQ